MTTRFVSYVVLAMVTLAEVASAGTSAAPLDLLSPPHKAALTSPDPTQSVVTLSWQARPGTAAYRIVVSTRADLGKPVIQRTRTDRFAAIKGLPEGSYHWRVEALDPKGAVLGTSEVASFSVPIGAP